MSTKTQEQAKEIVDLADDARALMDATAHLTGKNVQKARARLALALENEKAIGEELANASADMATHAIGTVRDHITVALDRGKELYETVHDDVVNRTKAADHTVRENPYKAIGIALGIGALAGCIMSARHAHSSH